MDQDHNIIEENDEGNKDLRAVEKVVPCVVVISMAAILISNPIFSQLFPARSGNYAELFSGLVSGNFAASVMTHTDD